MPTVVQFRRGTTAQNNTFTGAAGEISYDTEVNTIRVHDGSTVGGFALETSSSTATLTNKTVGQHWIPSADVTYDLGDSATKWRDLYLSGSTIYLGDATITSSGTSVVLPAGSFISGAGSVLDSASALAILSGGTGITYNSGTGEISTTDADIVHDNLSGFVADEHVAHSGVTLTAGTGLNGGGDISSSRTFNIDSAELYANFSLDGFNDYVADEHVAHSGVTMTAGSGLTGGGNISASRTFNIGEGTGITVSADAIATNDAEIVHDNLSGFVADEHIAHSTVSITAGSGLTGGGTIAATRTLNIGEGTGITVSADAIATNDAEIVHDNLSGFVADEHIAHSGVTMTAGAGLTGGGTIAATRTFNVGAGTGVTVNANKVAIGQDVATNADVTFATMETTGNVVVGGNLTVSGTTTTVNTETINLADNIILINSNEAGTPSQDGGIEIERGTSANKTLIWNETTDKWTIGSETFVANTFEGDLTGDVTGNASTATALETARTIGLSGDVTATGVSFDGTGNITLTTAMAANSVDLTTHTTGNYVASITNGNYITGANGGSEGAGLTLAVDATSANAVSKVVARDASGSFAANQVEADLVGNASTATVLQTARTIGLSGDVTATGVSFNGGSNITLSANIASNAVGAAELNVAGNGTTSQFLRADGDGSFTWATPTDTNTTYSAGTAMDLSGTTFNLDLSELSTSTTNGDGDYFVVVDTSNAQRKLTKANIALSEFNNDAGWTSNVGDITGVTAGTGLTGGGSSGSVTLNVSGVTSSMFSSPNSLVIYNSAGTALKTIRGPGS